MIKSLVKVLIYFVLFVSVQIIILNNINLFRIATPFLYLYIIVKIPVNVSRSQVITISFLLGIVIDMFSNTLGMHAAACSLAGMLRNPLMYTFSVKEFAENASPSYRTLGVSAFMKYVLSLVVVHHILLFLIESISLFDPVFLIFRIFANVILTVLFIFIIEAFNLERKRIEN
jgi:rod shape-determining protein MreD